MEAVVQQVDAREILDSRGRPTVEAAVVLNTGHKGVASVPAGASTGTAEAMELRDGEPHRYGGWGCRKAVANVRGTIARALVGRSFAHQKELDAALIELDGTGRKERLGANAILAVSLAFARASAACRGIPLYEYASDMVGFRAARLPRPSVNLFSGGCHAGRQVSLQDVMLVPHAATIDDCLAMVFSVYQEAVRWCRERYGVRPLKADEGGLAPDFPSSEAMLDDAVRSIERAGLTPGRDMSLAVDIAATHFVKDTTYILDDESCDAEKLIARLEKWSERFPLVSIEDGLAENDWEHWPILQQKLGAKLVIIGDDLLCTQPARIEQAIRLGAAGGLLLKVNQIGTLSEAASAWRLAHDAGWHVCVSARSGETEDHWLADLAVAWGHSIKVGSLAQSDRLAKYNRLLEIEHQTGWPLWPVAARSTIHGVEDS
ncbi:MAG: enolase [Pirellulaceae bacterium]|nr:MAG: enolase [Pirellulaceae bacterium]